MSNTLLSDATMAALVRYARAVVNAAVRGERVPEPPDEARVLDNRGAFVTLHSRAGELRGCLGMTVGLQPLWQTIREMAQATPVRDTRFDPVSAQELDDLVIEISVLTPLTPIAPEAVEIGRHGLMIRHRGRSGLLLPQVPGEWGWDRETFLKQTCRKAGLGEGAWKEPGAQLLGFEAQIAGEAAPGH